MKKSKHTLEELVAATLPELASTPEIIEWDRMPAVGREWPNPGWDEALTSPDKVVDESPKGKSAPELLNKLPPPAGYESWLDYAVETFDTRSLEIEALFADDNSRTDRQAMRESARQELLELRLRTQRNVE